MTTADKQPAQQLRDALPVVCQQPIDGGLDVFWFDPAEGGKPGLFKQWIGHCAEDTRFGLSSGAILT